MEIRVRSNQGDGIQQVDYVTDDLTSEFDYLFDRAKTLIKVGLQQMDAEAQKEQTAE